MPAPGAKCPDCILAARRQRELGTVNPADGGGLARSPEEAQARDRSITELLQFGPATFERLSASMPGSFENDDARNFACRMALKRMMAKELVRIVPEGYARA